MFFRIMMKRGFTLIELLVVISIIGLLATIVLISISSARTKADIAAGAQQQSNLDNTLQTIGRWDFSDCGGTVLTDQSGDGYTGTIGASSPAWSTNTPLNKGCSLQINSANGNYATIPNIPLDSRPFTVAAWLYKNDANDMSIFGGGSGPVQSHDLALMIRGSKVWFGTFNCDLIGNQTINPGQWYFLTWVMDSNQAKSIYINGTLDSGPTVGCGYYLSYANFIGQSCCGGSGLAYLTGVRLYNSGLTAQAIGKLYAEESPAYIAFSPRRGLRPPE